ncbi:MAG: hypothetical protein QM286_12160 [Acidobacteriota bacterium]|nr:hypothetical protein [Acidobacteriota bacterium]
MTDTIRAQLMALDAPSGRRLRDRLTLLDVRCRACGEAAFTVLATRPWVVRTYGAALDRLPPDLSRPLDRRDARLFNRLDTDNRQPARRLIGPCRCSTHEVTEAWLWAVLDAEPGTTRRVVTLPRPPRP